MGTNDMIADFYTNLLQRDLFRKMRDKIMGITLILMIYNICADIAGVYWD